METELTKTDRFINLFMAIACSARGYIDDNELREILGQPSKSQYHKYLNDLIKDKSGRKACIDRQKVNGTYIYKYQSNMFVPQIEKSEGPNLILMKDQQFCEIRVYDQARERFGKDHNIAKDLLRKDYDYDVYRCRYEDKSRFISQVFSYADDLEIVSPLELKDQFIKKAQKAAFLNMTNQHSEKKSA